MAFFSWAPGLELLLRASVFAVLDLSEIDGTKLLREVLGASLVYFRAYECFLYGWCSPAT